VGKNLTIISYGKNVGMKGSEDVSATPKMMPINVSDDDMIRATTGGKSGHNGVAGLRDARILEGDAEGEYMQMFSICSGGGVANTTKRSKRERARRRAGAGM